MSRPAYWWAMVKVGLVIRSVTPRPRPEALGERGLARAHLAGQQHEVARLDQPGQRLAHRLGGLAPVGPDDDLAHDGTLVSVGGAPPAASLARTRSARIWAIGAPPPRSTAAGW